MTSCHSIALGALILIGCGSGLDASGLGFDDPPADGEAIADTGSDPTSGRLGTARAMPGYADAAPPIDAPESRPDTNIPIDTAPEPVDTGAPCGSHFDPVASQAWVGCPAPGVPGVPSSYPAQLLAAEVARVRAGSPDTRAESACGGACTCLRPQNALLCHGGPSAGLYVAAFGSAGCLPCPAALDSYPGRWW